MQTLELHLGEAVWQTVVRVDGVAVAATLVELTIDPATHRTGLRLETATGTRVLTGTLMMHVDTATPVAAGSDLTISEWQVVRRFAETHRHELLARARVDQQKMARQLNMSGAPFGPDPAPAQAQG